MLSIEISENGISSNLIVPDKQGAEDSKALERKQAMRNYSSNSFSVSGDISPQLSTQPNTKKPELELPKSAANAEAASVAETEEVLKKVLKQIQELIDDVKTLFSEYSYVSSGKFAAAMTAIIAELGDKQINLKLIELDTLKAQNQKLLEENQEKINQAEDAAKEAKKSNTVNTVLGVLGAIIGAILAPFTGGVFGVLLGVVACTGFCSAIVNNDAVQRTMSPDVGDVLGKTFMGLEIAAMIASALVGGAGLLAGKLAASSSAQLQKVGQYLQKSSVLTESSKTFANTVNFVEGTTSATSETVNAVMEAKVSFAEADLYDKRSEIEQLQNYQDRLKGQLKAIMEQYQSMLEALLRMISQSGDSLIELLKRRAMV